MMAILKVLDRHRESVMGSRELSRELRMHGINLTERTVRYHLKIMDERGWTRVFGKEGRRITDKGIEELKNALVSDKVGFIIGKIENLSYQTTFDIATLTGNVILNITFFPVAGLLGAVQAMGPVFASPYVMSDRVLMAHEGESIGDAIVPEGMIGIGTVCSVTINGVFLKSGIPVTARYGGLVEIEDGLATRFTSLISYEGSSLDPLIVFIRSRMTNVKNAVSAGSGKILASFREIPVMSIDRAEEVKERLKSIGMGGVLAIGNPNQPLLEVPVSADKAGIVIIGGLNPIAALEEAGIQTESAAMATLIEYAKLSPFNEAVKGV